MEDTRNFRSSYYEKVGCRSVEEKKSLEILLKENPVTLQKLFQFLKLFSVPSIHRGLLYNLLYVYPVYMESKEFVLNQKKEIYNDLYHALQIMRYIDEKTPRARVFYAMYLLQQNQLGSPMIIHQEAVFPLIAEVIIESLEVDIVESYFITKNFYKFSEEILSDITKLKLLTFQYLEKEDEELYKHLKNKDILERLPFEKWYPTIFSNILNKSALIKIFDKIASGSNIVIFLFIVICSHSKFNLKMRNIDLDGAVKIIETYAFDDDGEKSDVCVNKTIDTWQKYCMKK